MMRALRMFVSRQTESVKENSSYFSFHCLSRDSTVLSAFPSGQSSEMMSWTESPRSKPAHTDSAVRLSVIILSIMTGQVNRKSLESLFRECVRISRSFVTMTSSSLSVSL